MLFARNRSTLEFMSRIRDEVTMITSSAAGDTSLIMRYTARRRFWSLLWNSLVTPKNTSVASFLENESPWFSRYSSLVMTCAEAGRGERGRAREGRGGRGRGGGLSDRPRGRAWPRRAAARPACWHLRASSWESLKQRASCSTDAFSMPQKGDTSTAPRVSARPTRKHGETGGPALAGAKSGACTGAR